jgi:imidazolonepropionase-like amidohydrolase
MQQRILVVFTLVAAGLGQSTRPAQAEPGAIALRGGKILTVSHGVIENGVLVMQNGKITAVGGANTAIPREAKVIDVAGMTVYPGLIDAETRLGLTEVQSDRSTDDTLEPSDEIMPHMHVADAFHAETALIPVARINGITNAVVAPAIGDTLPGQDAFIQLAGRSADEMLLARDIALPLNFTGRQRRNESFATAKFPQTRMGMAAQLRQAFIDAQDYEAKLAAWEKKKAADPEKAGAPPKRDLKLEALLPYLHGQKPMVLAAEEANDLETILDMAKEYHLKVILNHLSHASEVLDRVAASGFPVIVGPIYEQPKEWERYDAVYRLPAEMVKHGIKIAFATYDSHKVRDLPYAAGYAVAFGLPPDEALKAVTLNPAQMFGVDKELGSLDVGKTANVVVANGEPLDVKTDVKHVFIAGQEIPLVSRQTELRDQYWK